MSLQQQGVQTCIVRWQLRMPSASLPLVFPHLDLADLIFIKIISLEISIREFLKLFIFTIPLVSMEMGFMRLSGVNS